VARAIVAEMQRTHAAHVFLDLTHRGESFIRERFPRIYETCLKYGVNIGHEGAPVAPAAHYAMGGVHTDLDGRTTISRLYAAGEAACTGVHGANRLASNSLLEGVVFGARAARAMLDELSRPAPRSCEAVTETKPEARADMSALDVQVLAWQNCGIVRDGAGLAEAVARLESNAPTPEARNVHAVALLIARCALAREESRGAHFRSDFPEKRNEFAAHSVVRREGDVRFR